MPARQRRAGSQGARRPSKGPPPAEEAMKAVESDPAVERGERIATGKMIARGGKSEGDVPGATEQRPRTKSDRKRKRE